MQKATLKPLQKRQMPIQAIPTNNSKEMKIPSCLGMGYSKFAED